MPDHRILVSSETHEPKHITNSTGADAGKVITPLGGGASELRALLPAEVGIRFAYGEIGVDNNTTAIALGTPSSGDTTLYTESDYIQITNGRIPDIYFDENNSIVVFDNNNKTLITSVTGVYEINFWGNVLSSVGDNVVAVKFKKGTTFTSFTLKNSVAGADKVQNVSGGILTRIVAEEETGLWIAAKLAANITISDLRMSIKLIREE